MLQSQLDWPQGQGAPSVAQLWRGVILRVLVQVVSARSGEPPADGFGWQEASLVLQDYNETMGCVAFTQERVVGGFYYFESERNPLSEDEFPPYDAEHYFAAAPPDVLAIARQSVLPYLMTWIGDPALADLADEQGTANDLDETKFVPVVTAAFWSEGRVLAAGEPWSAVYHHGAHILWREFSDPDPVLDYFEQVEEVPRERLALARRLYERRLATAEPVMVLTADEYAELIAPGAPQLEPVREQLAAVGIALPT